MKLLPGDIVEIETPAGFSYVQVTHNHPSYPEVVRSLGRLHESRPADINSLAGFAHGFKALLPLGSAIETGRVKGARIGTAPIPEKHKAFPTFRMAIPDKKGGIAYWWLWDGEGLRYVTELDEESMELPIREVMSVDKFLARLS